VITYEEYHPYGSTAFHSSGDANLSDKRYRYTGKEKDEETGFYYYGARYYVPWLGRWTAADPAGFVDGPNAYAYASNRPVVLVDPGGLQSATPGPQKIEFTDKEAGEIVGLTDRQKQARLARVNRRSAGIGVQSQLGRLPEEFPKIGKAFANVGTRTLSNMIRSAPYSSHPEMGPPDFEELERAEVAASAVEEKLLYKDVPRKSEIAAGAAVFVLQLGLTKVPGFIFGEAAAPATVGAEGPALLSEGTALAAEGTGVVAETEAIATESAPVLAEASTDFELVPPKSTLSQPGGLAATEGTQVTLPSGNLGAPAHALTKHGPEVPLGEIRRRVSSGQVSTATKFTNRAQMEEAVASTIDAKKAVIDKWLKTAPTGKTLAVTHDPGLGSLGVGFKRVGTGLEALTDLEKSTVVVKASGGGRYVVQSAFPSR
jgi:RHS repeat-associated protein